MHKERQVDERLPRDPDELLNDPEWTESSHPGAKENGHRTFENIKTGERFAPLLYETTLYNICDNPTSPLRAGRGLVPLLGVVLGVCRIAVATVHTAGHLLAALIKQDRGHLYHAKQGGYELLKGMIEAIPVIGRIFCYKLYWSKQINWYGIKIYNPEQPDALDKEAYCWRGVKAAHPSRYIKA